MPQSGNTIIKLCPYHYKYLFLNNEGSSIKSPITLYQLELATTYDIHRIDLAQLLITCVQKQTHSTRPVNKVRAKWSQFAAATLILPKICARVFVCLAVQYEQIYGQ